MTVTVPVLLPATLQIGICNTNVGTVGLPSLLLGCTSSQRRLLLWIGSGLKQGMATTYSSDELPVFQITMILQ